MRGKEAGGTKDNRIRATAIDGVSEAIGLLAIRSRIRFDVHNVKLPCSLRCRTRTRRNVRMIEQ